MGAFRSGSHSSFSILQIILLILLFYDDLYFSIYFGIDWILNAKQLKTFIWFRKVAQNLILLVALSVSQLNYINSRTH